MTENEVRAVRFIKNIKNHAKVTLDHIAKEEPNVSPLVYKGREEKANTILAMVEELQQYRAIGTLEELQEMKKDFAEALSDWRQYCKIGTLEECRAAVEKQTSKKVISSKYHNGTNNYSCPVCKRKIISKIGGEWCGGTFDEYCDRCGQKLDWSDEE